MVRPDDADGVHAGIAAPAQDDVERFTDAGGRGVELADQIDSLRVYIAARS